MDILQRHARALCHAVQRIVGHVEGNVDFVLQSFVKAPEQCAAAGQENAVCANITDKLRRCFFERSADHFHDCGDVVFECLKQLHLTEVTLFGQSARNGSALDGMHDIICRIIEIAERYFDLFGSFRTEQNLIFILDISDDGLIEAAKAMGVGSLGIIVRVYLREGAAALARGTTITVISLIGLTAMAGYVGAGGLGDYAITYGYNYNRMDIVWASVIAIVLIVTVVQGIGALVAKKSTH